MFPTDVSPTTSSNDSTVAPATGAGLEVISGWSYCQIDAAGCATDGVGEHGNDEACTVQVNIDGYLTATEFDTEPGYDYVTIGVARYQGNGGPSGVAVTAGSTFTWQSDGSITNAGWTICFSSSKMRSIVRSN